MKKTISILMSIILSISVLSPVETVIAQEIAQNNAVSVNNEIVEMVQDYNIEYEELLDKTDADSVEVDNRVIVKTKSKINTYDAVDEVYGLGYAFIQFDDSESANNAIEHYEKQGLVVQNDRVYNINNSFVDTTSYTYSSDSTKWAYTFTEADTTLNYFKNKSLNDVTVGIIDSGVGYTHTLLKSRIVRTNVNFSTSGSENDEMDDEGHGTNCAGIIAQCTPDNVKIEAFKAGSNDGHVYTSSLICTYEYILNMQDKPDVINMSFGGYGEALPIETQLLKELKESGICLVASAGNENLDTADSTPANDENVIAVSAFDQNGEKCYFSNYGTTVDISAPGVYVYTSAIGNNYISNFAGTSASAPFVTSAIAIILMQDNTLSTDDVYEKLKSSAFNTNKPADRLWSGAGLLNFSNLIDGDRKSAVTFNYESGEYNDSIKVELSSTDRLNTKIIYTTDNTLPSASNGTTYTKAIEVDTKANIIAAAFPIIGSSLHSEYSSASYQIFKNASESDFEITDSGEITAYNGKYVAITVPETINGITPVSVGENCFKNSDIVHIEFPDTVTLIKTSAFENSNLQKIKAIGVTKCLDSAFKNCTQLYEENMPNISELNDASFYNCSMLTKLSFSQSLRYALCGTGTTDSTGCLTGTSISEADFPNLIACDRAFENTPIKYANLPNVKQLDGAFKNCKQLSEVYIPNVYYIGRWAFGNCVSLSRNMDFSNITWVDYYGFADSLFETIDLPNCTILYGNAFSNASAKSINLPACKTIPGNCFSGDGLEYVSIPNAEVASSGDYIFRNCFSLKYIYAPKLKSIPDFNFDDVGNERINQGETPALEFVYTPQATKFSCGNCNYESCLNLKFLYAPSLEKMNGYVYFPKKDDFTIYLSDSLTQGTTQESSITGKYTIIAPKGSYAEEWSNNSWWYVKEGLNFVASDSLTNSLGRSICTSVAGLRFGYSWDNISDIEDLATDIEYGFVYSQKGIEDLSIDTVGTNGIKKKIATNRVNDGNSTSFNLVITNIPSAYYGREITARAYVCIDGMYFYSDILKGSFSEVANLVTKDNEIDSNTKSIVQQMLQEV